MKKLLLLLMILAFISPEINAQKKNKKKSPPPTENKVEKKKSKIKKYSEVITKESISDPGLFTVHKVDEKYYFEIQDSLLNREILNVSRISGIIEGFSFGGAGMKAGGQKVFRWERFENKLLLRYVSHSSVADENKPIYQSVRNNNFEPVIESFNIEAMTSDSSAYVIDVSSFFTSDVAVISPLTESSRKRFGVRSLDKNRSLIEGMKSFPLNTEVQHILTYAATNLPANGNTGTLSLKMNQSFVLLPKEPMMPRLYDRRVNYFSVNQTDYGLSEQKAAERRYVTRWRLEPKDPEAFARGELVEPIKPIVYYIDPSTPEEWRPYIKQGVEDWQEAFEAAGFKNAILAKDAPTKEEDPDWSPEDVRYSVIRYISTTIQNAMGPHVHDPRSGEIIESDIMWYHNVMNLLRNWYFVQTAAVNPDARSVKFKEEIMGKLIRFVAAHEVGHTLGLPHNMGASSSYPVDSLRSATFTATSGTAPSIMDYARFNYVAQPGDKGVSLDPKIGVYDKYAIMWAYKPIVGANSSDEEKETLHKWILEHQNDGRYRFGFANGVDPSAQTEDLGDNSMKASEYGLANLKRIVPNLVEWTDEDGKDYDDLEELYGQVVGQFRRYIGHVTTNVGGIYTFNKTYDQEGMVHVHVEKAKQKQSVLFMNTNVFATPQWLLDENILGRINRDGIVEDIKRLQNYGLSRILNESRLKRMVENEALNSNQAYKLSELYSDLRNGLWGELSRGTTVDPFRRNIQRAHIDLLGELLKSESDVGAISRAELKAIQRMSISGGARSSDPMTKMHLEDLQVRIGQLLDPQ